MCSHIARSHPCIVVMEPFSHQRRIFCRLSCLFSISLSVNVATGTWKLEVLLESGNGRDKSPHFGRSLALLGAMFNNLAMSACANTKIAPTKRKTKQRKNQRFPPIAALIGPLNEKVPASLDNGLGQTQEAIEQEVPDLLVVCQSSPMTWPVGVSILHW